MSSAMKILILGAGGIGGYFGAHLIRAGADITYLVRDSRKALLDAIGLTIQTPTETFVVQPQTITAASAQPIYDLIVLAPKSYDLENAMHSLQGALGHGLILPFLNGLDHLNLLDRELGRERVLGGVAHIAATLSADGTVRRLTDLHRLTIGPRHDSQRDTAQAFWNLCQQAPFESLLSNDIEQALWDKWVFLATLAGMTTLCRGSVGQIVATDYGRQVTTELFQECLAVAERSGHPIATETSDKALAMLTAAGSGFTASMLRDLQAAQPTEHDHILGAIIRRGQNLSCKTPLLQIALTHLQVQVQGRQ
jgi:2-dehydropantoate 2-reductase